MRLFIVFFLMLTSNSIWGQNDSLLLSRELKNGDTLFFSFQVSGSDFIMEEIQLVKSNDEIELSFYKQSYGKNWEHPDVWRTSANFKSLTLRKLTVEEFGEFEGYIYIDSGCNFENQIGVSGAEIYWAK